MSKLAKALISALPYAHLLGIASAAKVEEDSNDKKQRNDESDEDYANRMDDEDAEGEDESDPKNKPPKGKKAAKEEEDDTEDDGDKEKAARTSERARCAAIFQCAGAGVRPDVAAHLAFSTDMSSAAAIAMLKTVAAGCPQKKNSLASRMDEVKTPNVGADGAAVPDGNSAQGIAAFVAAASKKARGQA